MKNIRTIVFTAVFMAIMSFSAFAGTYFNLDVPAELYEEAYAVLAAHSQDAPSANPEYYRLNAGIPEGVDLKGLATACADLLGSSDIGVVYFPDATRVVELERTYENGVDNSMREYYHGGTPAFWVGYKSNANPAEAFQEVAGTRTTAQRIADSTPSDMESACRYIARELAGRCSYDDAKDIQKNNEMRSAAGCLLNGSCVCSGYTKAFNLICYLKNIPSYYVSCLMDGVSHAINAVYSNGRYVWVDVTNYDSTKSDQWILKTPVDMAEWAGHFTKGQTMPDPAPAATTTDSTFSPAWYEAADGSWKMKDSTGADIRNAWLCDDAVASNGRNVWYLMDESGRMVAAGLVRDNTGNYYSLETEHNGYYGMLRTKSGNYGGIYMEFSQAHDGTFGAIVNQEAIEALKARYGITDFAVGNGNCVYTSVL